MKALLIAIALVLAGCGSTINPEGQIKRTYYKFVQTKNKTVMTIDIHSLKCPLIDAELGQMGQDKVTVIVKCKIKEE